MANVERPNNQDGNRGIEGSLIASMAGQKGPSTCEDRVKGESMKLRAAQAGVVFGALSLLLTGCVAVVERPPDAAVVESDRRGPPPWAPAHGWRRKHETYYYYPAAQVYYYPSVGRYYWIEGREWRYGSRLPRYFVVEDDKRVVLELDYEPHTDHAKFKALYPPDYHERDRGKGRYR